MRRSSQFQILLLGILALAIAVGGVYATWTYAMNLADSAQSDMNATMGTWDYGYTITFINNGVPIQIENESGIKEDAEIEVTDNAQTIDLTVNEIAIAAGAQAAADMGEDYEFSHWINAGSTRVDEIDAGNTKDIVLYPAFKDVYTAIFVDLDGNILSWDTFTTDSYNHIKTLGSNTTAPTVEDCIFDHWEVRVVNDDNSVSKETLDSFDFTKANKDITIYPVYVYDGDVNLIPVDNNGDGETDEYQVGGYSDPNGQDLVKIPEIVNGDEITEINDNAFSGYEGVHAVTIPGSVDTIGSNAFADDDYYDSILGSGNRETVTIYYSGDPADLNDGLNKDLGNDYDSTNTDMIQFSSLWDDGMGDGSQIFFLDKDGKVDASAGYWKLVRSRSGFNIKYTWTYYSSVDVDYSNTECDCGDAHEDTNGLRPDYIYWPAQ